MLSWEQLKFSDEHKKLLTAQVLLTEIQERPERRVGELVEAQKQLDLKMAVLAEAHKDTGERLNALIAVVDDPVRRNPGHLQ